MKSISQNKYSPENKSMVAIFIVQITLLIILTSLFFIGLDVNNNLQIEIGDFWFAIIMGAMGASVALMKRTKESKVKFENDSNGFIILSTLMPILYGTIMAGIAYLLFMSGILSGDGGGGLVTTNIFPNFTRDVSNDSGNLMKQFMNIHTVGITDTGKLLVWCFITGYSEKFITGILNNMESGTMSKDKSKETAEE